MMLKPPMDLATFEAKAGQVADTLKAIGNARRLMLLCKLVEHGDDRGQTQVQCGADDLRHRAHTAAAGCRLPRSRPRSTLRP